MGIGDRKINKPEPEPEPAPESESKPVIPEITTKSELSGIQHLKAVKALTPFDALRLLPSTGFLLR